MILKLIQGLFSLDLLIEVRESLLTVKSFSGDKKLEIVPIIAMEKSNSKSIVREIGAKATEVTGVNIEVIKPFTHSRSMISSFNHAELIVHHAIRTIHDMAIRPAPRVVVHQLEKNEGGLTDIENRVLLEMAYGGGAREAIVYTGPPINVAVETYESIKSRIDT